VTPTEKDRTSYIVQGEFRVSRDPSEVLSTVLGSCVAVCLWDPAAKVGGMNHFLLPAAPGQGDAKMLRYGAHAMEVLINEVLKLGARRKALQAKLFGGANVTDALGPIGQANATFALAYLNDEDIPCLAKSLGGTQARRIVFRPVTGHVRQLIVDGAVPEQKPALAPLRKPPGRDDVILF
jgi:chemotaxis protein CheD